MTRPIRSAIVLLLTSCFVEPGEDTLVVRGAVVSDPTGAPLPGAHVELRVRMPFAAWNEPGHRLGSAITDGEGRYTIVVGPPRTADTGACGLLGVTAALEGFSLGNVPRGVAAIEGGCQEGDTEAATIRLLPVSD
ncbi:MAG: carboxypeptidase-like regulatory domain-containing protein [Gemmatimonadota bacterium]